MSPSKSSKASSALLSKSKSKQASSYSKVRSKSTVKSTSAKKIKSTPSSSSKSKSSKTATLSKSSFFQKNRSCILITSVVVIIAALAICNILFLVLRKTSCGYCSRMEMIDKSVNPCVDFYQRACGKIRMQKLIDANNSENYYRLAAISNAQLLSSSLQSRHDSSSHAVRYLLKMSHQCAASSQPSFSSTLKEEITDITGERTFPVPKSGEESIDNDWMGAYAEYVLKTGNGPIFELGLIDDPEKINLKKLTIFSSSFTSSANLISKLQTLLELEFNPEVAKELEELNDKFASYKHPPSPPYRGITFSEELYETAITIKDLSDKVGFDFLKFLQILLKASNINSNIITNSSIVYSNCVHFLTVAGKILTSTSTRVLKNYFGVQLALKMSSIFKHEQQQASTDRWERCSRIFRYYGSPDYPNNPLNNHFENRIFLEAIIAKNGRDQLDLSRKQVDELVSHLRQSFFTILKTTTWLDQATQKAALEKLAAMRAIVSYADWILDDQQLDDQYGLKEELPVVEGNYIQSLAKIYRQVMARKLQSLDEAQTKPIYLVDIKGFTYYSVSTNEIVIPVGSLQPPFFEVNSPAAINFGSIGDAIGHEITHHFDSIGRRFDAKGKIHDWWSKESAEKFAEKAKCFVEQYSAIVEPITGQNLPGYGTLNEDIADNGGLKATYSAFDQHRQSRRHSARSAIVQGEYDGYTEEELFFYAYAHDHCASQEPDYIRERIQDLHSLDRYRVNVVLGNFEPFARAFNCSVGMPMNPSKKCAVW